MKEYVKGTTPNLCYFSKKYIYPQNISLSKSGVDNLFEKYQEETLSMVINVNTFKMNMNFTFDKF